MGNEKEGQWFVTFEWVSCSRVNINIRVSCMNLSFVVCHIIAHAMGRDAVLDLL